MIKLYVPKGSTPDTFHEVRGMKYILEKMWLCFQPVRTYYGIFANMHKPNADMVIFTELGLGVLELKDYPGLVSIDRSGTWRANGNVVKGGGYPNPLDQVQGYSCDLREKIIPYLPGVNKRDRPSWDQYKSSTGVCFTNPDADIQEIKKQAKAHRMERYAWEDYFTIMTPEDVAGWACCLRFRGAIGPQERKADHPNFRVNPENIENMFVKGFNAMEWEDMLALMPRSEAYGYLILEDPYSNIVFPLAKNNSKIGRDPEADVVIPSEYDLVSHKHCQIERTISGCYLSDYGSKNGTFLKGQRIQKKVQIKHGDSLTLGDKAGKGRSCTLRFEIRETSHIEEEFTTTKVAPLEDSQGCDVPPTDSV